MPPSLWEVVKWLPKTASSLSMNSPAIFETPHPQALWLARCSDCLSILHSGWGPVLLGVDPSWCYLCSMTMKHLSLLLTPWPKSHLHSEISFLFFKVLSFLCHPSKWLGMGSALIYMVFKRYVWIVTQSHNFCKYFSVSIGSLSLNATQI